MQHWYDTPEPVVEWLIHGLITSDGHNAFVGKPKAGKSSLIRNLVASVVKSRPFLGRTIDLPENTGRVLYIHLDRKDADWRVVKELKQLGMTRSDASRLTLRTAHDLPGASLVERLEWLKKEVTESRPHLIVIDLLWQFIALENANDYNVVLSGINKLQDALRKAKYRGALVVALHARKASSANDDMDDILGSSAQRGSFGTLLMARHHSNDQVYTVKSDQTDRDDRIGELPETIVTRSADRTLELSGPYSDLVKIKKKNEFQDDVESLVAFLSKNPGSEADVMVSQFAKSKKTVLRLIHAASSSGLVRREGTGIKGEPFRYFAQDLGGELNAAA